MAEADASATTVLPMFPLGSVLVPTVVLPLHIFEERYRALVADCLDGDREFGVAMIERGHEVGGGDERSLVGCVAQIVDAQQFDDGRWALACVGTRRITVERWLPDDPYPRAEVAAWPDPPATEPLDDQVAAVIAQLRTVLALQAEVGDPAPPATIEIESDPTIASYQVSALGPFGPLDRQRLLSAPTVEQRLGELATALAEEDDVLRARIALD